MSDYERLRSLLAREDDLDEIVATLDIGQVDGAEREAADGCCRNDAWRGHACQYHQGWGDGYEAALRDATARIERLTRNDT